MVGGPMSSEPSGAAKAGVPSVVVSDAWTPRHAVVAEIVSACGYDVRRIDAAAQVAGLVLDSWSSVGVVGLADVTAPRDRALDVMATLKRRGFTVVAYGDGADRWPLGARARSLLAGAGVLLDSDTPDFRGALQSRLFEYFRAQTEKRNTEDALRSRMRSLGLVGETPATMALFQWIVRVSALSDLPTLITGETGTGKELVARAIHQLDAKRQRGAFVPLNCAALSPTLAESELFGHRRGAFTGAERDRKGLFRSAEGGVLFLDEIGDLDRALQTKLLRVLQDGRVLAVGEDTEVAVNMRVIAATNRDLPGMVRAGSFREDLFHRLNVVSFEIAPLRQRRQDIGPLVAHFVEKYRALNPQATGPVGADFIEALAGVQLPGNARQLENVVRWAVVNKADAAPFVLSSLPPEVWKELTGLLAPSATTTTDDGEPGESRPTPADAESYLTALLAANNWKLERSLQECERVFVRAAFRASAGNQSRMARLLEITPRSVYNKLRRYRVADS